METPRIIVTTEKHGKTQHTIHRAMPHDPVPVIGKRFGRLGIVVAVRPMEGSN